MSKQEVETLKYSVFWAIDIAGYFAILSTVSQSVVQVSRNALYSRQSVPLGLWNSEY